MWLETTAATAGTLWRSVGAARCCCCDFKFSCIRCQCGIYCCCTKCLCLCACYWLLMGHWCAAQISGVSKLQAVGCRLPLLALMDAEMKLFCVNVNMLSMNEVTASVVTWEFIQILQGKVLLFAIVFVKCRCLKWEKCAWALGKELCTIYIRTSCFYLTSLMNIYLEL